MASEAIERLRGKGYEPTLDHISAIIELARRIQEPTHRTFPWLSHGGVEVGGSGRVLRPMTIKSGVWFEYASEHILKPCDQRFGCALAMEYGHDEEYDFRPMFVEAECRKAIIAYIAGMNFTIEELDDAMERIFPEDLEADVMRVQGKDSPAVDKEDMIARLVAISGLKAEYWMSNTLDFAQKVLTHGMQNGNYADVGSSIQDSRYQEDNYNFQCELIRIERELQEEKNGQD